MVGTNIETWWIAVKTATLLCGAYLAWLMAFERWFEPMLRRLTGSIARRLVVWVPAGRGFRIWGLMDRTGEARDAAVALVGALLVLTSALLPAVILGRLAAARTSDPLIAASSYLTCVPLMAVFVLRMLLVRRDGG
jgi:hypothetical protein